MSPQTRSTPLRHVMSYTDGTAEEDSDGASIYMETANQSCAYRAPIATFTAPKKTPKWQAAQNSGLHRAVSAAFTDARKTTARKLIGTAKRNRPDHLLAEADEEIAVRVEQNSRYSKAKADIGTSISQLSMYLERPDFMNEDEDEVENQGEDENGDKVETIPRWPKSMLVDNPPRKAV